MDIVLKGAMDGVEAAAQLRDRFDIPVIFVTAYADEKMLKRARVTEPFGYLLKPFDERELHTNIQMALYKHRMESRLRESEHKFRNVVEQSLGGVALCDEQGAIIEWNQAREEISGLKQGEAMGRPLWDLAFQMAPDKLQTPENHRRIKEAMLDVIKTGQVPWPGQIHEQTIQRPDGTHRIVETLVHTIETSKGFMLCSTIRDITERKKMEDALQKSEARSKAILNAIPDMMFQNNRDGTYTGYSYNGPKEDFFVPPEFFMGKKISDIMPPERAVEEVERINNVLEGGDPQIFEYQSPIGDETHCYEARMVKCTENEVLTIVRDITERVQAEKDREYLLAVERKQRLLANTLQKVTLALTSQTNFGAVLDEILRQARHLVLYDTANIMLLKEDVLHPAHWQGYEQFDTEETMAKLALPLADFPLEAEIVRTQKSLIIADVEQEPDWVVVNKMEWVKSHLAVPICHRDRILGVIGLDSDALDTFSAEDAEYLKPLANAAAIALENARLYEQALQDAKTKALLLREVNHRVKNNLVGIIGMLHITRRFASQKEEDGVCLPIIEDLLTRIGGLSAAHNMLSASEWSPVPLDKLADRIIKTSLQTFSPNKRIQIVITSPNPVYVSSKQANSLAMIINELTTNPVKYTLPTQPAAQIAVHITSKDETVLFQFRDNGPGFPEDVLYLERHNVGIHLIQRLAQDSLGGTVSFKNDSGAVTPLYIPAQQ